MSHDFEQKQPKRNPKMNTRPRSKWIKTSITPQKNPFPLLCAPSSCRKISFVTVLTKTTRQLLTQNEHNKNLISAAYKPKPICKRLSKFLHTPSYFCIYPFVATRLHVSRFRAKTTQTKSQNEHKRTLFRLHKNPNYPSVSFILPCMCTLVASKISHARRSWAKNAGTNAWK